MREGDQKGQSCIDIFTAVLNGSQNYMMKFQSFVPNKASEMYSKLISPALVVNLFCLNAFVLTV